MIRDYASACAMLKTRARKLQNNTYLVPHEDARGKVGDIGVRLHATEVVTFHKDGSVTLDSGGWRTPTTKDRINAYQTLTNVGSDRGVWYCALDWSAPKESRIVFADGIRFYPDGRVKGAGQADKTVKARRAIREYCKAFMRELDAGNVPAPSGGDCWYCLMRETTTGAPLGEAVGKRNGNGSASEHLRSHLSKGERYYVPALLQRAIEVGGGSREPVKSWYRATQPGDNAPRVVSEVALWYLGAKWNPNATEEEKRAGESYKGIALEQIEKALRNYLYREMGV